MRIKSILIKNFKGVVDETRIEIKQLTLLFGQNSAGKSTILHALLYLYEILVNGNTSPSKTTLGGKLIDFGGFENLVNNQDISNEILIGIELDLEGQGIPLETEMYEIGKTTEHDALRMFEVASSLKLFSLEEKEPINSISVNFSIRDSSIECLSIYLNGNDDEHHLIKLQVDGSEQSLYLNPQHSFFSLIKELLLEYGWSDIDDIENCVPIWVSDLLPQEDEDFSDVGWSAGVSLHEEESLLLRILLHNYVTVPLNLTRRILRRYKHIGPLRSISPANCKNNVSWASGDAIWKSIKLFSREDLGLLNSFLNDETYLDLGYKIAFKDHREISDNFLKNVNKYHPITSKNIETELKKSPIHRQVLLVDTNTGLEVSLKSIGIGVSQVIPIVAALIIKSLSILTIEQPELHLHPRLHNVLADLFVNLSKEINKDTRYIIETHSEYFLAHLLGRISESDENKKNLHPDIKLNASDIAVYYVNKSRNGTQIKKLIINEYGDFDGKWPEGFFESVKNKFYYSVGLSNELDGLLKEFGYKFWNVLIQKDEALKRAISWRKPITVTYSDSYINTPESLLLFTEIMEGFKECFKSKWEKPRTPWIKLVTRGIPTNKNLQGLTSAWGEGKKTKKVQSNVMKSYLIGRGLDIEVEVSNRKLPHARELDITWDDGAKTLIRLDQGVGSWVITQESHYHEDFDHKTNVEKQVSWLLYNYKKIHVKRRDSNSVIHIGINNYFD